MLHGILFHRLFGIIKPAKIDCLDVTFPAVRDIETEKLVDDTVKVFLRALQGARQGQRDGQIEIYFTEKKQRKAGWFQSGGEEEVAWEQWYINVTQDAPRDDQERDRLQESLSNTLQKAVMSMLDYSASERGRAAVPLISTAAGISPFPVHIILRVNGQVVPSS